MRSVDQFNGDFFFIGKSTQRVSEVFQSDNWSVYQLVSQSVFYSYSLAVSQSVFYSYSLAVSQSVSQSVGFLFVQSGSQSVSFLFIQSSRQAVSFLFIQSGSQSVSFLFIQSGSHSVSFLFIQSGSQSVSLNKIIYHFKSSTQLIILNYLVLIIPNCSPFFYSRFVLQLSKFSRDSTQDSERSLWCFYQSQFHS